MDKDSAANKKIILKALAARSAGDTDAWFQAFSPDVRWTIMGTSAISRLYESRDDLFDSLRQDISRSLETPPEFEVQQIFAEGDAVAVRLTTTTTARSGEPYNQRYCWILRLKGQKIVEGFAYMDTALIERMSQK